MALSIHRIWYLFKMQWVENRKLYTLGLLAMVGIIAAFFFTGSESENAQSGFFEIGLLLSSAIFTSTILSRFAEKNKSLSALMLPASAAEKTIIAIIYSMIIFPLVYIVLIYPVMIAAHYFHSEIQGDLAPLWDYRTEENIGVMLMVYFMLQAFVLFCSAAFRRFVFVKTAVLVCIITFSIVMLSEQIQEYQYKDHLQPKVLPKGFVPNPPTYATEATTTTTTTAKGPVTVTSAPKRVIVPTRNFQSIGGGPFMEVGVYSNNVIGFNHWDVVLPLWQQVWFTLLFYLTIPFFWMLTWLKLKEKTLM